VLPQTSLIEIEVLETGKRPVRIEAGAGVIRHVASAKIRHDPTTQATLLFDPDLHLAERIIREQFLL
jgi:NAD+ kinase